jgi:hypothetical protein
MKENNIRVFLIVDCERILTLRQHCYGALILTFCRIRHIAVWMAALTGSTIETVRAL